MFPIDLLASAVFEGFTLPVHIRRIGVAAMFIETRIAPLDLSIPIRIVIATSADGSAASVTATCSITEVRVQPKDPETGLLLRVDSLDEGADPGAWQRFLKRHHFRSLARD